MLEMVAKDVKGIKIQYYEKFGYPVMNKIKIKIYLKMNLVY